MIDDIQFITSNWKQNHHELIQVRTRVFIEEQQVPDELEWDEFDQQSTHFLAFHNNKPIATARLKPDGQIGRMAVMKDYRNKGVGTELLTAVLLLAKDSGYSMVYLHAQKQAVSFYRKFNFTCNGIEFLDANILHQAMYKNLA